MRGSTRASFEPDRFDRPIFIMEMVCAHGIYLGRAGSDLESRRLLITEFSPSSPPLRRPHLSSRSCNFHRLFSARRHSSPPPTILNLTSGLSSPLPSSPANGNHPFRSHSIFPKSLAAAPLPRCISAFPFLSQEPQLQEPPPPTLPQLPRSPQPRHWEPLLPRELAEPDPRTRCWSFRRRPVARPHGTPRDSPDDGLLQDPRCIQPHERLR